MLDHVLTLLKDELQAYVTAQEKPPANTTYTSISPVMNDEGKVAIPGNTLGLTLVNLEEERILRNQTALKKRTGTTVAYANPPIKMHLYILVTANFGSYDTSLRHLSQAIAFLSSKNVYNPANTPTLDPEIEQLTLEMHSLTFEQQNQLWGTLGGKYLPSVLYVAKLVPLSAAQVTQQQPPIQRLDLRGNDGSGGGS